MFRQQDVLDGVEVCREERLHQDPLRPQWHRGQARHRLGEARSQREGRHCQVPMLFLFFSFAEAADQGDQMIWKKLPNFLKSSPNNAKIRTIFLNRVFWSKFDKFVSKDVTIFGDFLVSKKSQKVA